jgi:hypothetical protein
MNGVGSLHLLYRGWRQKAISGWAFLNFTVLSSTISAALTIVLLISLLQVLALLKFVSSKNLGYNIHSERDKTLSKYIRYKENTLYERHKV